MNQKKVYQIVLFTCFMLTIALPLTASFCMADDHKKAKEIFNKHGERHKSLEGIFGHGHDEGNETTGQIVAWSLVAANLTVALSLALRGIKKFTHLKPEAEKELIRFNSTQKKYLMRFHYILNPLILLLAILHWILSRCKSTALPEWGLITMCVIVSLGIILKFKLCPKTLLKNVYKIHTQPVLLFILISLLLIGHLSMD